ncbi:hypothetical protein N7468_005854 [Penicillium chermesinum]|uniref:Uncharacterized protein n=1 Tax=Penicillium chermesinum TaxID=63820 RepID=A0A9W9TNS9_9EURO|nr:uncharacterized protein N7468_005854 [Penicillium chermesinum]KAJ5232898.1 hypothetical protein N7468_005854 [Penicillium chermesinum]
MVPRRSFSTDHSDPPVRAHARAFVSALLPRSFVSELILGNGGLPTLETLGRSVPILCLIVDSGAAMASTVTNG